ncbi:MAG: hypothetical protein U9R01_07775 [candidate division WOR-3 bacterium]|nr:hypothetical protein [candidate division WOR-3 bacterium]
MKKVGLGIVLVGLIIGCASSSLSGVSAPDWYLNPPEEDDYIFGTATSLSNDLQLTLDKAKQDARLYIAEELESNIQGLIKKFDEEVGRTEDSELLQQFTKVSKNVVDLTLVGSRVRKSKIKKRGRWIPRIYPDGGSSR